MTLTVVLLGSAAAAALPALIVSTMIRRLIDAEIDPQACYGLDGRTPQVCCDDAGCAGDFGCPCGCHQRDPITVRGDRRRGEVHHHMHGGSNRLHPLNLTGHRRGA